MGSPLGPPIRFHQARGIHGEAPVWLAGAIVMNKSLLSVRQLDDRIR